MAASVDSDANAADRRGNDLLAELRPRLIVPNRRRLFSLVALSYAAHTALFALAPRRAREPHLNKSRVVSVAHASLAAAVVGTWMVRTRLARRDEPSQLRSGIAGTLDEWCAPMIAVTTGYFLQDLTATFLFPEEMWDIGFILHHVIGITSFGTGLATGIANPLLFIFLFEEVSTPFMNLRKLFAHDPRRYRLFTVLFVATFFTARLLWGNYVFYRALRLYARYRRQVLPKLTDDLQVMLHIAVGAISRVLNTYWAVLILQRVMRLGRPGSSSSLASPARASA